MKLWQFNPGQSNPGQSNRAGLAVLMGLMLSLVGGSAMAAESVHGFKVKSLDGKDVDLAKYKGKVLLIVNVASECGATPQYKQLQTLHKKYSEQGLVVLGFPCNQFGGQEPGTAKEIEQFCKSTYDVSFPMFAKIEVNGDNQAPLYDYLKSTASDHANIKWNFEKFVVGKDGKVVSRFGTGVQPDAEEVVKVLEDQLAKEAK